MTMDTLFPTDSYINMFFRQDESGCWHGGARMKNKEKQQPKKATKYSVYI